jgi:peptide/nickel transport system permease protein
MEITIAQLRRRIRPRVRDEETVLQRHVRLFLDSRMAVFGLAVLSIISALAFLGPLVAPQNPYDLMQLDIMDGSLPPMAFGSSGQIHLLGTDDQGRDMVSAILYGLRISLGVGALSTLLACSIGTSIGVLATYAGGRIEALVMRLVDLQLSFPTILVALVLLASFGRGLDKVVVALIVVQWAYYARAVRGSALVEKRREYIEAARSLVIPRRRIIFRHLLPNCLPPIIVIATVQIAQAISLEATLSFLGVGVPVTEPSLGMLIANGYKYLLSGKYWVSVFPGVALVITVAAINLVGDRLRDIFNPRLAR